MPMKIYFLTSEITPFAETGILAQFSKHIPFRLQEQSHDVRITAPSIKEAKALKDIKNSLYKKGYKIPLIADIHFTPNAAIEAAKIVEKVRINPGNYADKKKFEKFEYTDDEYNLELERIYEKYQLRI